MKNTSIVDSATYFIGGALVGLALGVLFAPKSGDEAREDVGDWLDEKREKGEEILSSVKDRFAHRRNKAEEAFRHGAESFRNAQQAISPE